MKKLKNKWFYFNSCLLYVILVYIFSMFTILFIEQYAGAFLISTFAANKAGSMNIMEVVVDDYSMQEYKTAWSKDRYADILDYFHKYAQPRVIGLDMTISSFDKNNPKDIKFLNQVSKMDNLVSGFAPEVVKDNSDKDFLKQFKRFSLDADVKLSSTPMVYNGVVNSSEILSNATKNYGSVLIGDAKGSGYVYSGINLLQIDDSFYPSLAFKMYLLEHNTNNIILDSSYITVPETGLKIPYLYNQNGEPKTNIRYYPTVYINDINTGYSHQNVSASRILDTYYALNSGITPQKNPELFDLNKGKYLDPSLFKDKVIFIGSNFTGPSTDVLKTPMAQRHAGVDIQASMYDNLVNNYFLYRAGIGTTLISFLILSLFSFIIILRLKFFKGIFSIFLFDILYLIVVFICASNGYIMNYAMPLVAQFVTTIFGYSFKFIAENRNKEKIKQAMGKYLSQDVMKNVVRNIDDLKLGGKRAIVTVLFSDIRGFTSLSEKMSAEEVSMILNEYFTEMEPIISKYNGVINKFIGDAVLAIFGEPIQDINHAQNAVKCAYEMLKKLEYLREKWLFEGKPKIEIGVGINTGEVFLGNIGTETRMEYTVIGDTVNLASRIESYNKVYKTNLLVSSSTYAHIADIADVIKISEVQIRGKAKKMNIYEVLRIDRDK